jgi:Ca2+-binding EF-hand superfamily protein
MQKEAMSVLVKFVDVSELKELKRQFKHLDATRTGTLTYTEIETALRNCGIETA